MLLLEVLTLQGPELHLYVPTLQRSVLLLRGLQGPWLHLDVSHFALLSMLLDKLFLLCFFTFF